MKFSGKGNKNFKKSSGKKGNNKSDVKTRKEIRKESRQNKKIKRVDSYLKNVKNHKEYFSKNKNVKQKTEVIDNNTNKVNKIENKKVVKNTKLKETKSNVTDIFKENMKVKKDQLALEKEMRKHRKDALMEANEEEDRLISTLEKQLRLKKRKSKTLPSSFTSCGLDYILDVCDPEKMKNLVQTEKYLQDSGSEFEDDLATIKGKKPKKKTKIKKSKPIDDDINSDEDNSDYSENDEDDEVLNKFNKRLRSKDNISEINKNKKFKKDLHTDDFSDENDIDFSDEDDDSLLNDLQGDDDSEDGGDEFTESDDESFEESDYVESMDEETMKNTFVNSRIGKKPRRINDAGIMESSESEPEEIPIKKKSGKKTVRINVDDAGKQSDDEEIKGQYVLARKNDNSIKKNAEGRKKKNLYDDSESDEEDMRDEEEMSDDNSMSMITDDNDEMESNAKGDDTWEDIYGRTRDKKGNVVEANKSKYIPPALRAKAAEADSKKRETLERLRRQLKGLINRLAENNMQSIASQIEELYMKNSRNDMNESLIALFTDAIVSPVLTPERLIMEHAMLTAILHANVGTEVGAYILQTFVTNFDKLLSEKSNVGDKRLDNLLAFICHLYTFKIFDNSLLYNILSILCDRFEEKEIELILVVLRNVGFTLRKDDPIALKELVLRIQRQAGEASELKNNSRVNFMLDMLLKIKNNNMSKLPQYDPSHSEHLKKLLKSMIRKGNYVTELKISLEDLLKADERGRWWIVGSAWTGPAGSEGTSDNTEEKQALPSAPTMSDQLARLAKKLRINTDVRKNIFSVLMTAEDYEDAFEKLHKLGLKGQMMNEIINVLLHCLLQEKQYNHYYALIANRFCQADRRHRMVIQYSVWDKFKEVDSMKSFQVTNLAKCLAYLFIEGTLPLSVLKVIQLVEMTKGNVRLIRQILLSVLYNKDEQMAANVFVRVNKSPKLHIFREGLRLFLHHFLLKNIKETDDDYNFLKERINLADRALQSQTF